MLYTPVVISLDYVSQQAVRKYTIVTDAGTFSVDIMGKCIVLQTDKNSRVVTDLAEDFDVPQTYQSQIADWLMAIADYRHEVASPFADGLKTAELMLNIKQATL